MLQLYSVLRVGESTYSDSIFCVLWRIAGSWMVMVSGPTGQPTPAGEQPMKAVEAPIRQRGCMEQDLNSRQTAARPSHGAIEDKIGTSKLTEETKEQKIDQVAMRGAKRAENRILNNEEKIPGSTIFSK